MASKNTYPVGLKLPLQRGNNGYFDQNFNTLDQAYTNIKNLLMTSLGERRLNVNFGSTIPSLIFEQITSEDELVESLTTSTSQLIGRYFQNVTILSVDIKFDPTNTNRINMKIIFQLKNSSTYSFGESPTRTIDVSFILNI